MRSISAGRCRVARVVLGRGRTRGSARMYPLPRYFLGEIRFPAPANRDTWPRSVTRAGTASEEGVSRAEDSGGWETTRNGASL